MLLLGCARDHTPCVLWMWSSSICMRLRKYNPSSARREFSHLHAVEAAYDGTVSPWHGSASSSAWALTNMVPTTWLGTMDLMAPKECKCLHQYQLSDTTAGRRHLGCNPGSCPHGLGAFHLARQLASSRWAKRWIDLLHLLGSERLSLFSLRRLCLMELHRPRMWGVCVIGFMVGIVIR